MVRFERDRNGREGEFLVVFVIKESLSEEDVVDVEEVELKKLSWLFDWVVILFDDGKIILVVFVFLLLFRWFIVEFRFIFFFFMYLIFEVGDWIVVEKVFVVFLFVVNFLFFVVIKELF